MGGFPFSHWCIKTFPINPLFCRGGVSSSKITLPKSNQKIIDLDVCFRPACSSKKNVAYTSGFPFSHWCIKTFPINPLFCRGGVSSSKITLPKSNQKIIDLDVCFRPACSSKKIVAYTSGFPFSHWCIKTCPVNPLSCRGGVSSSKITLPKSNQKFIDLDFLLPAS